MGPRFRSTAHSLFRIPTDCTARGLIGDRRRRCRRVSSNHLEPTTGSVRGHRCVFPATARDVARFARFGSNVGCLPRQQRAAWGISLMLQPTAGPQFSDAGCRASEFASAQTARRVCHGPGPALRHYTAESTPPIRRIITLLGHRLPKPGSHARDSRARSPGTGEAYCRALRFLSSRPCALSPHRPSALAGRRFLARD